MLYEKQRATFHIELLAAQRIHLMSSNRPDSFEGSNLNPFESDSEASQAEYDRGAADAEDGTGINPTVNPFSSSDYDAGYNDQSSGNND